MANYNFSDLKDKVVIIVGGFGLIGSELCKGFIKNGSKIIIADKAKNIELLSVFNNLSKDKVEYLTFDIGADKSADALIKSVIKKYDQIDDLVNSSWPKTKDWGLGLEQVPYSSIKDNLLIHLGGYYNLTQKIALQMKKQKFGSIINFSSIYGLVAPTFPIYEGTKMTSPPAYPLIKGGVNMMTKYFASYFGKYNVRVNCISPGGVYRNENPKFVKNYNKLTPLGRMANPDDLVMPTLFLASEGSKYITGHNLLVDGGWTIH